MFIGYSDIHKAWQIWTPTNTTKPIQYSRDVRFDEDRLYWDELLSNMKHGVAAEPTEVAWELVAGEEPVEQAHVEVGVEVQRSVGASAADTTEQLVSPPGQEEASVPAPTITRAQPSTPVQERARTISPDPFELEHLNLDDIFASPVQDERPPHELQLIWDTPEASPNFPRQVPFAANSERALRAERRHLARMGKASGNVALAMSAFAFSASGSEQLRTSADGVVLEPATRKEAQRRGDWAQWEAAEMEQLAALEQFGTWVEVALPKDRQAIGCRWVYKLKLNEDGNADRHKARLVAQGFSQIPGQDYTETFAPTARLDTVRTLLSIAIQYKLLIHQLDVVTAYLQGDLDEEIYMRQPPGYEKSDRVLKLLKPLYGLKQAGRAWNTKLHHSLASRGYSRCFSENCEKAYLKSKFKVTDGGEVRHFLGIKIESDFEAGTATLSQTAYIEAALARFGLSKEFGSKMPTPPKLPMRATELSEIDPDLTRAYAQRVGCLKWIAATTRADLIFTANALGRFESAPTEEHFALTTQAFRYLRKTADHKLTYRAGRNPDAPLVGFCDADYANDVDTRRSTTGFVYYLFGNPVTWSSRLQPTVALSTTEAEYMALCEGLREGLWIKTLLGELGLWPGGAVKLFTDNEGCRSLATNPHDHRRTKHIDVLYRAVRESVEMGKLTVERVDTKENPSDVCTKPFTGSRLHDARLRLQIEPPPADGEGANAHGH
ncbi:hypothetical protein CF328_g6145 [Tilletia controversa]|nr:hypothetical protein CF328_g6145 [Tilletia controversa]